MGKMARYWLYSRQMVREVQLPQVTATEQNQVCCLTPRGGDGNRICTAWVGGWGEKEDVWKRITLGTSLVAQWLRICLPMQGTRVQSLVREDPTCHSGATEPVHHNYWACALEPASHNYWSLSTPEPVLLNKRSHCNEKPTHCNEEKPLLAATRESLHASTKTQGSQK